MSTEKAVVLYSYTAENADELTLMKGDIITVLEKETREKGWYKGELNGKIGVVPFNYVELIKEEGVKLDIMIEDSTGKTLPAKKVFALCIGYLKNDLMKTMNDKIGGDGLSNSDIRWVLTVPAIWNDAYKQVMREAAESREAGILGDKLTIALEPEAASLFCRYLPVEMFIGKDKMSVSNFKTGTRYIVLDAGGGTVDVIVHEIMKDGKLKEIHKASGGAWGGIKVDEAFKQFLVKLVGGPVMTVFQKKHMDDFIDLFTDFEHKKRCINPDQRDIKITIRIPFTLQELLREQTGESMKEAIKRTEFAGRLTLTNDKMRVDISIFQSFFGETVKSVIDHIKDLIRTPEVHNCVAIVMVGGFSESPMLQEKVRTEFPNMKIVIPDETGLAVLKGAVIFGHSPTSIAERVCKLTYGNNITHLTGTDQCNHRPTKTEVDDSGDLRCYNIFSTHVTIGQTVALGEEQKELIVSPITDEQTTVTVDIYSSTQQSPQLTTDLGCNEIGSITVPMPNTKGERKREIGLSMKFGGTEIEVKGVDKTSGRATYAKVDFLG